MSSSVPYFNFLMIAWTLGGLLSTGLLIVSSIVLLREKSPGPWIMLAGSAFSLFSILISRLIPFFSVPGSELGVMAISSLGVFGGLIFGCGLLFFSLTRSGQAKRIAELEAILGAPNNPSGDPDRR